MVLDAPKRRHALPIGPNLSDVIVTGRNMHAEKERILIGAFVRPAIAF